MNRKKSLILYIIYAVALVLVITFGSELSVMLRNVFTTAILNYNVTDVEIGLDPDEPLTAGESYELDAVAVGKFDEEGGLRYASSNRDVLTVDTDGRITTTVKFDGPETTVDVTVTSSQDKDFSKVITFTVRKEYSSDFSCYYYIEHYDLNKSKVYVGMTVYPYVLTRDGVDDTKNEFEVVYDEEYFRYDEEGGGYVAIKETPAGETVYFKASFPNGKAARSGEFSIVPYVETDYFDSVIIKETDAEEATIIRANTFIPYLYKDGAAVPTKAEVSCSDPDKLKTTRTGRYYFSETGDYQLTFTLQNGFSKTVTVKVRNKLALPLPSDAAIADTKQINAYIGTSVNIPFSLDKSASYSEISYEYDEDMLELRPYSRSFTLIGRETGDTTVSVIVDDGYERLVEEYTVKITENRSVGRVIRDFVTKFVSKVLGHLGLFCLLGVLAYNYYRFIFIKRKAMRAALLLGLGLPIALVSEFVQLFMEDRGAGLGDVLIDMCGYGLGLLLCYLFVRAADKRRKKVFLWTAIDLSDDATEITERVRAVCEELGVQNPALSLPMHISLKISDRIPTKSLPRAVEKIADMLSKATPTELIPECIERRDGVVWIRHRDSEWLCELHRKIVDFYLSQYGVMPHGLDGEFIFHTTLFVGEADEARRVYEALKDEPLPERFAPGGYLMGVSESGLAGEYRVIKNAEFRMQNAELAFPLRGRC